MQANEDMYRLMVTIQALVARFPADMAPQVQIDVAAFFSAVFAALNTIRQAARQGLPLHLGLLLPRDCPRPETACTKVQGPGSAVGGGWVARRRGHNALGGGRRRLHCLGPARVPSPHPLG